MCDSNQPFPIPLPRKGRDIIFHQRKAVMSLLGVEQPFQVLTSMVGQICSKNRKKTIENGGKHLLFRRERERWQGWMGIVPTGLK